jgi:hypothetical protein
MLYVGQASLQGDIARYAQHFNLVELLAEPGKLPKPAKLSKWVETVGGEFAFALRLSTRLWEGWGQEDELRMAYLHSVAEVLKPKVCLLQTPASATPTARNRKRLAALCDGLRRDGVKLGWEPRGVWEQAELVSLCDDLDLLLVQDLSREYEPAGSGAVYTRLLALGGAARVRTSAVEEVVEKVDGRPHSFIVIEGSGARGAAKRMREALTPNELEV